MRCSFSTFHEKEKVNYKNKPVMAVFKDKLFISSAMLIKLVVAGASYHDVERMIHAVLIFVVFFL